MLKKYKTERESQNFEMETSVRMNQSEAQPSPLDNSINQPYKLNLSNSKSDMEHFSQKQKKFTLQEIKNKAKSFIINFLKTNIKMNTFSESVFNNISEIESANNLNKVYEYFCNVLEEVFASKKMTYECNRQHVNANEVTMTVRSKESMKFRLIRDDDKKKKSQSIKKFEEIEKNYEDMKKEVYNIREEKNQLQKKIVGLVEQFRDRKHFYLGEIRKLTEIINMSSKNVSQLILTKTKQAKYLEQKQERQYRQISNISELRVESVPSEDQKHHSEQKESYKIGNIYTHKHNESMRQPAISFADSMRDGKKLKYVTSIQHLDELKSDNTFQY